MWIKNPKLLKEGDEFSVNGTTYVVGKRQPGSHSVPYRKIGLDYLYCMGTTTFERLGLTAWREDKQTTEKLHAIIFFGLVKSGEVKTFNLPAWVIGKKIRIQVEEV